MPIVSARDTIEYRRQVCGAALVHLCLEHNPATIHNKVRTVDVGARTTSQQHTDTIQLADSSHSSRRVPRCPGIPHLRQPIPSIQDGIHIPRRNRIDPDPLGRPLSRQRRLQRHKRRFTNIVRNLRLREIDPMRRDRSRERNTAVRVRVRSHMTRHSLSTEEGAGRVHFKGLAPGCLGHREGGLAAYDAGEAEEVVDGAEGADGGVEAFLHAFGGGHVDGYAEDADGGEFGGQGCDCGEGGAEGAFEVPEAEARGAVFEHSAGAGEAEGAGAAGYWKFGC
jgi:hypothetical protein